MSKKNLTFTHPVLFFSKLESSKFPLKSLPKNNVQLRKFVGFLQYFTQKFVDFLQWIV